MNGLDPHHRPQRATGPRGQAPAQRQRRWAAAWLCTCLLTCTLGCQFGAADQAVENTCRSDADCDAESRCENSLCVQHGATELSINLEVTPNRMPDGSQPITIVLGPFALDGRSRVFELPLPTAIAGSVHKGAVRLAASLHFTQAEIPEGQSAKTIATMTTETTDLAVQLLRGVTYHVTIEPTDTSLPPYAVVFKAEDGARLDVDYARVKWTVERFLLEGLPKQPELTLRALDSATGEPVSSSAPIGTDPVFLVFPPKHGPFRLEIASPASYATGSSTAGAGCDVSTPGFPLLGIDEAELRQDETGTNVFRLPKIPQPIVYSGVVQLCPGSTAAKLAGMPMALDAKTLSFGQNDSSVAARYNATTTVTFDDASGELRFCTKVLPGDYVVVVTPPANVSCQIFAEHRSVEAAGGAEVLVLRAPAVLSGRVNTSDMHPVSNASIDARALGEDLVLTGNDPSVPSYNRSVQATTDLDGKFRLPLDVGSYDFVFKPASESGFAWQVVHDIDIGAQRDDFTTHVTLGDPVLVQGTLRYTDASRGEQRSLGGAEVRAYTQIPNSTRSIEIGRAVADEDGKVHLLIAPTLQDGH